MVSNLPEFVIERWYSAEWDMWYWKAIAPCGGESSYAEEFAREKWKTHADVWCHHSGCDLCDAVDHTIVEHDDNNNPKNWFPVLHCNAFPADGTIRATWNGTEYVAACDGVNHKLIPFGENENCEEDCYWWYQGNYPNGWVYWQGDWRCGPCAEKTIFGGRS